jgi:hypothetical protein
MRTPSIIKGLKNSQKFRVIFKGDGSENDVGLYMTVKQMSEMFATVNARSLCYEALEMLVSERKYMKTIVGLGTTIRGKQIQIDLV